MTERSAILLAGAAHLALLAALSLSWAMAQKTLPSFEEMTPVEVVQISDVPTVTEAPKPSIETAPQETQEAAAPEPRPAPEPAPPPEPPRPEPPKPLADLPAPEAKPVPKPTPKPTEKPAQEAKPQAAKPSPKPLDTQTLANLLDKKLPKAAAKPLDTSKLADSIERALPKGAKLDARASASLAQAILGQLSPCWSPPLGGGEDVQNIVVVLDVQFNADGTVAGRPTIADVRNVPSGRDAYVRAFKDAAVRTVLNPRCSPLKLPAQMYAAENGWKHIQLNISASTMT